jgi:glycosyltransferase involved in cell wall biosynthesis
LSSPWASLDLDDDDETLARARDPALARAYHRLIATFARRFSAVSLASRDDARSVGRRHGLTPLTVANAVDMPAEAQRTQPGGDAVVFVGNLTYLPNVDAAVFLATEVLPALRARLGRRVLLTIVGAHDPEGPIAGLGSVPGVRVAGFVDDLTSVYASSDLVVAPLAAGSGTRIKLLEAFAHGCPVVTTPIGASGLAVRSGEQLLIGESLDEVVTASTAILNDRHLSSELAAAAREFVRSHHSPTIIAGQVREFLRAAKAAGSPRL